MVSRDSTNTERRHLFVPEGDSTMEADPNLNNTLSDSEVSTDISDRDEPVSEVKNRQSGRSNLISRNTDSITDSNSENFNLNNAFEDNISDPDSYQEMITDIDGYMSPGSGDMILTARRNPLYKPRPQKSDKQTPVIDLDAEEQHVVEILDDEEDDKELRKSKKPPESYKPIKEYKCPICFESPDMAMITECGHVFCLDCLFQMVNNSNPNRHTQNSNIGLCALCRSKVDLKKITLLRLRKKFIPKPKDINKT